jgi:succinyl-diaminopimelate desuccinylase
VYFGLVPEIDRDGLIDFARELVRIPSVHRPADGLDERLAAALVAAQMRRFGWQPLVEEVAPGRPNVIAVVEGGHPGPALMLEGHTDVVTEGDPAAWTHPPFAGEIDGGRLYGRGAADMKAGVAAMLFAAAAIARSPFPGRIVVAALADEEGMMLGVRDFVRRGHAAHVDAALICEPEGGEVCIAQKGAIRLRVDAHGRMAHGAMPHHGDNPIPRLAAFISACASVEARLHREHGEHPHLGWDHVTPTILQAGATEQLNVIPASAWAGIDIRTIPAADHAALVDLLRRELGERMTLTVIDDRPATQTPESHPLVRAVVEAHRRRHGAPPPLGGVPGATDGTILRADAGIPIVTYGPGGKWIAHQVDEYVELEELVAYAEAYVEAARLFLGGGAD